MGFLRKLIATSSVAGLAFTGTIASTSGYAQSNSEPSRTAGGVLLEEVLVTVRKKAAAESLQGVAVAATVFGADQLDALFVKSIGDLTTLAPNVQFRDAGSQRAVQNFFIRGMGLTGSAPSDEPTVGIVQDGVYWGVNYGANPDLYDLESIEILRGPQGTLFGRNVTAGAVNLTTKRAGYETTYGAEMLAGTDERFDVAGHVGGALIEDKLAGRLSVQSRTLNDGYVDNRVSGNKFGELKSWVARGSLLWDVADNFDVTLMVESYSDDSDPSVPFGVETEGTLASARGYVQPDDDWDVALDVEGHAKTDVNFYMLEANWEVGNGVVTSISGYRDVDNDVQMDTDGTEFQLFDVGFQMKQHQFSEELRYASNFSEVFDLTVGLYYFTQKWDYGEQRRFVDGSNLVASSSTLKHDSSAAFATLDYHINESWTLNVGGRYSMEKKKAITAPFGSCDFYQPTNCTFGDSDDKDWSNFSPSTSLTYNLDDDSIIYGSYSRGFRSGGFTLRGSALTDPYDEEVVDAFEVGTKTTLNDGKIRLNVAAFYNEYGDLQRSTIDPATALATTRNAAEATIWGLELELTALLSDGIVLGVYYGYTDPSYEKYDGFDTDGDGIPNPEAKNLDFARVPKNEGTVSLTYETLTYDWGSVISNARYSYSDGYYLDDQNTFEVNSQELVKASVQWVSPSSQWTVALVGNNLTDEKYFSSGFVTSISRWGFANMPRNYAIDMAYQF